MTIATGSLVGWTSERKYSFHTIPTLRKKFGNGPFIIGELFGKNSSGNYTVSLKRPDGTSVIERNAVIARFCITLFDEIPDLGSGTKVVWTQNPDFQEKIQGFTNIYGSGPFTVGCKATNGNFYLLRDAAENIFEEWIERHLLQEA